MHASVSLPVPTPPSPTAQDRLRQAAQRIENARQTSGAQRKGELRKAAQEMEALFIQMLLKQMRATIPGSGTQDAGLGKGIYTSLFDMRLSVELAQHGGIGLSDMIYKHLEGLRAYDIPQNPHK